VDLIFNSILYVTRDLVDNNNIALIIVWFALQRNKVINLKTAHSYSRNMSLREAM